MDQVGVVERVFHSLLLEVLLGLLRHDLLVSLALLQVIVHSIASGVASVHHRASAIDRIQPPEARIRLELCSTGALEQLTIIESLDLPVEALNDLLSLLHDAEVALVHIVGLEQVFGVDTRFLENANLLDVVRVLQLELRHKILEVSDLGSCLLGLQLGHQVLKLIDLGNEFLGVLSDLVHEHGILLHFCLVSSWSARSETQEVGELRLHFVVLEQEVLVLLVDVLVLDNKRLLLFVNYPDLVNQELGGNSLIVLPLLPRKPLVRLEQFALRLVDDLLELLSVPLELHFVALSSLL